MKRILMQCLDSAMSVATAAGLGWLISIPGIAAVGALTGVGALTLLTNPSCILFAMLTGAIALSGFMYPESESQVIWVSEERWRRVSH